MTALTAESTTVPAVNGKLIEIQQGGKWPLPYRGSQYSVKKVDDRLNFCWTRFDTLHCSESLPDGLIPAMLEHKWDSRGIIKITPYSEVITKREVEDGSYESVYLGKLDGVINFTGFNLNPSDIKTCNIWPGFQFKHGEEFAVWNRAGNDDYLYWTYMGIYFRSIERYPELCAKVKEIRPRCCRIYVTEYSHIWMNLPANEVSPEWHSKFKHLLQEDKAKMEKNEVFLRAVYDRVSATQTYPIYLGKMTDFDSGNPPRTHFSSGARFGKGGEDTDDGDVYDSKYWKRMRRDY